MAVKSLIASIIDVDSLAKIIEGIAHKPKIIEERSKNTIQFAKENLDKIKNGMLLLKALKEIQSTKICDGRKTQVKRLLSYIRFALFSVCYRESNRENVLVHGNRLLKRVNNKLRCAFVAQKILENWKI